MDGGMVGCGWAITVVVGEHWIKAEPAYYIGCCIALLFLYARVLIAWLIFGLCMEVFHFVGHVLSCRETSFEKFTLSSIDLVRIVFY
jgi:hypothetical protein